MTVFLPRNIGETAPGDSGQALLPVNLPRGGRILVVEDEILVRMILADGLGDAGFVCAEAGDGAAAMRYIETDAPIDLLVSDIGLPGDMNGRELVDAARRLRPDLMVLLITGYADKTLLDDIGALPALPDTQMMLKPFDIDKLVAIVAEMVGQRHDA